MMRNGRGAVPLDDRWLFIACPTIDQMPGGAYRVNPVFKASAVPEPKMAPADSGLNDLIADRVANYIGCGMEIELAH